MSRNDIIPYANNPKRHPDSQVKLIASSIKNYGWDQPIVVDENNEVLKGHGRLQAAELLELEQVPVIKRTDLTEAQKKGSRIADNKASESTWDQELLAIEFGELAESDFDLDDTGFDDDEIDDILAQANDMGFLSETIAGLSSEEEKTAGNGQDIQYVEVVFSLLTEEREVLFETLERFPGETKREQLMNMLGEL